jgi:hypothetical protein
MKMSKVYITVGISKKRSKSVVLELEGIDAAKSLYKKIQENLPGVSVGVYGARDAATLRRSHRNLKPTIITNNIPEFIKQLEDHPNANTKKWVY